MTLDREMGPPERYADDPSTSDFFACPTCGGEYLLETQAIDGQCEGCWRDGLDEIAAEVGKAHRAQERAAELRKTLLEIARCKSLDDRISWSQRVWEIQGHAPQPVTLGSWDAMEAAREDYEQGHVDEAREK